MVWALPYSMDTRLHGGRRALAVAGCLVLGVTTWVRRYHPVATTRQGS